MSIFDLEFDETYGDFSITNGDVVLINSYRKYLKNYVVNKLKTQLGDIYGIPSTGMPFDKYIGKGIREEDLETLQTEILFDLLEEQVFKQSELEVFTLFKNHILYVRVVINKESLQLSVGITIDAEGEITSD